MNDTAVGSEELNPNRPNPMKIAETSRKLKIMLVEDDDTFRHSLMDLLKARFSSMLLETARDGNEALIKVEDFLPDLIFMDIRLPGQNGLVLTKKIKKLHPLMKIIILTGYDLLEYRQAAHECGANFFLSKGSSTAGEIQDLVENLWSRLREEQD